jgi:hypothetical protein
VRAEHHCYLQVCLGGGQRQGMQDASAAEDRNLVWRRAGLACVETYSVDSCSRGYSAVAGTGESPRRLRWQESAGHRMASWNIALEAELHWLQGRMMDTSRAGAFQDFQPAYPWKQLERFRWQDAAASSLPAAETQICTSVAKARADSLDAVRFVTSAPHLGSSSTHRAMPLATLLWSNSDPRRKDAMAVHFRRRCLCEKDRGVGHSIACRVIPAWLVEQSFVGWPTTECRFRAYLAV